MQTFLFEEENCNLLFEPFYQSSSPPTIHDTDSSKNIEPIPSKDPPRVSTAFSSPSQADKTNTKATDISIDKNESLSKPLSCAANLFVAPEVEEILGSENIRSQENENQLINSLTDLHELVRNQERTQNRNKCRNTKKRFYIESSLGSDSEEKLSGAESEVSKEFCPDNAVANKSVFEQRADSKFEHSNTLSDEKIITRHDMQISSDVMSDFRRQVMDTEERTRKYAAVEDTARLINTIQQSLSQRRGDDISRIVPQERLSRSPSNTSLTRILPLQTRHL